MLGGRLVHTAHLLQANDTRLLGLNPGLTTHAARQIKVGTLYLAAIRLPCQTTLNEGASCSTESNTYSVFG
jgi:hypothetical protein